MTTAVCNTDNLAQGVDLIRSVLDNSRNPKILHHSMLGIIHAPNQHCLAIYGHGSIATAITYIPTLQPVGDVDHEPFHFTAPSREMAIAMSKLASKSIAVISATPEAKTARLNDGTNPDGYIEIHPPSQTLPPPKIDNTTKATVDVEQLVQGLAMTNVTPETVITATLGQKRLLINGHTKDRTIQWCGTVKENNRRGRPGTFCLNHKAASIIRATIEGSENQIEISASKERVQFVTEHAILVFNNEPEPSTVPNTPWFLSEWIADPQVLYEAVAKIATLSPAEDLPITISSAKNRLSITGIVVTGDEIAYQVPSENTGLHRSVKLKATHLLNAINASPKGDVCMRIAGDNDPVVVRPKDQGHIQYLIDPVRKTPETV